MYTAYRKSVSARVDGERHRVEWANVTHAFARVPMVRIVKYAPADPSTPTMAVATASERCSIVIGTPPGPNPVTPDAPNRNEGLAIRTTPNREKTPGGTADVSIKTLGIRSRPYQSKPLLLYTFP